MDKRVVAQRAGRVCLFCLFFIPHSSSGWETKSALVPKDKAIQGR